jgi:hypothetical protein
MAELLIIRFTTFRINTQLAIEFSAVLPYPLISIPPKLICYATSVKALCIAPGIYTDPPNDFTTLAWFITNNMKIDKPSQAHLLWWLTNYAVDTITVI